MQKLLSEKKDHIACQSVYITKQSNETQVKTITQKEEEKRSFHLFIKTYAHLMHTAE